MQDLLCKLIDSLLNVFASRCIINSKGTLIYKVELDGDNYRVSMTEAIVRDAFFPMLVPNVMDVVEKSFGSVIT